MAKCEILQILSKGNIDKTMQVIYIMGSGHSGSTLLDIILGNHPDIVSVGELTYLVRNAWINNKRCACGKTGNECSFWSAVRIHWGNSIGLKNIENYLTLQSNFERFQRLPSLIGERFIASRTPTFRKYAEHTFELFKAISKVSGKKIIVDSSKSPVRGFALSMIPDINFRLIHLVRDGRGVAWSLNKKIGKGKTFRKNWIYASPWAQGFNWVLTNVTSEYVLKRPGIQGIRIKYEDLVGYPVETLRQIGKLIDVNIDKVANDLLSEGKMNIGHVVAGNRMRFDGSLRLRPDFEWKHRLEISSQKIFWLMAGWLERRYGFKWD